MLLRKVASAAVVRPPVSVSSSVTRSVLHQDSGKVQVCPPGSNGWTQMTLVGRRRPPGFAWRRPGAAIRTHAPHL